MKQKFIIGWNADCNPIEVEVEVKEEPITYSQNDLSRLSQLLYQQAHNEQLMRWQNNHNALQQQSDWNNALMQMQCQQQNNRVVDNPLRSLLGGLF